MAALIFLATLLFFLAGGGDFLLFGAPKTKVNCIATNFPVITVDRSEKEAKEIEVDDWRVNCVLTVDDKKIFDAPLTLAHPTRFREAMDAIEEFRTKTAGKLIKENQKI